MNKLKLVVFDLNSCTTEIYEKYYKDKFPIGRLFVMLGEIEQCPMHCVLCDLRTGKIHPMCPIENFKYAD